MLYDTVKRHAQAAIDGLEEWKAAHDEAMSIMDLELHYKLASMLFVFVVGLDSKEPEEELVSAHIAKHRRPALEFLLEVLAHLAEACEAMPVEDYECSIDPAKVEHMATALGVMLKGRKVWSAEDSKAAGAALDNGETLDLDGLRGARDKARDFLCRVTESRSEEETRDIVAELCAKTLGERLDSGE